MQEEQEVEEGLEERGLEGRLVNPLQTLKQTQRQVRDGSKAVLRMFAGVCLCWFLQLSQKTVSLLQNSREQHGCSVAVLKNDDTQTGHFFNLHRYFFECQEKYNYILTINLQLLVGRIFSSLLCMKKQPGSQKAKCGRHLQAHTRTARTKEY